MTPSKMFVWGGVALAVLGMIWGRGGIYQSQLIWWFLLMAGAATSVWWGRRLESQEQRHRLSVEMARRADLARRNAQPPE